MLGKLCCKQRSHMLYFVACMACIVCMIYYVASTRIVLCTCEIMHYVACIYCIVCTKCTCCIRLHISSACPLTYTCTWTGAWGCEWPCFAFFVFFLLINSVLYYGLHWSIFLSVCLKFQHDSQFYIYLYLFSKYWG